MFLKFFDGEAYNEWKMKHIDGFDSWEGLKCLPENIQMKI